MDAKMEENKSEFDDKNLSLQVNLENSKVETITENEPINKKLKLSENEAKSQKKDENECSSSINTEFTNLIEPSSTESKNIQSSLSESERIEPSTSKINESKPTNEDDDDAPVCVEHEVPEEGFIYPLEMDASDMLDEVDDFDEKGCYPTITERYFTPYYQLDAQKPGDDVCIRVHSNRICMISLAPSHIILQENKTIVSCNFKVSEKLDRSKNKVSGKAKHGAQPMQCNSNLCCLTCTDGTSYMVKCCMIGKLVEVNERLTENPELLKLAPHFGGFIAIVLPNLKHLDKLLEKLLDQNKYEEAIKKRKEKQEQEKEHMEEIKIEDEENSIRTIEKKEEQKNGSVVRKDEIEQPVEMEVVEKKETQDNDQHINDIIMSDDKKELDEHQVDTMDFVQS